MSQFNPLFAIIFLLPSSNFSFSIVLDFQKVWKNSGLLFNNLITLPNKFLTDHFRMANRTSLSFISKKFESKISFVPKKTQIASGGTKHTMQYCKREKSKVYYPTNTN